MIAYTQSIQRFTNLILDLMIERRGEIGGGCLRWLILSESGSAFGGYVFRMRGFSGFWLL